MNCSLFSRRSRSPRSGGDKSRAPLLPTHPGRSPARQSYEHRDSRSSRDRDGRPAANRDSRPSAREEVAHRREPLIRDAPYRRDAPPAKSSQPGREPPVIYLDEDQPTRRTAPGNAQARSPARGSDRNVGMTCNASPETRHPTTRA